MKKYCYCREDCNNYFLTVDPVDEQDHPTEKEIEWWTWMFGCLDKFCYFCNPKSGKV